MNTFLQLEYHKICKIIEENCHSNLGKKLAKNLHPLTSKAEIEKRLSLTYEIQELLRKGFSIDFHQISDLNELLYNMIYQTFSFQEFDKIIGSVRTSNRICRMDGADEDLDEFEEYKYFKRLKNRLLPFMEIEIKFNKIFSSDGDILDSASTTLKEIRNKRRRTKKSIQKTLNEKLLDPNLDSIIVDKIITERDERYVIPVRDGSANIFQGIQHGKSSSKSTIFIEPKEVVGLNNDLNSLKSEEKEEIFRIMKGFTEEIREVKTEISANTKILQKLDFYFGIANFCNYLQALPPIIVTKPQLNLINARHPLLIHSFGDIKKVIPFELELGINYRILVLSGPNTGGKTVTLKAVGLLTLMALSGIPIPADSSSEIGIFKNFFADIGDSQSLEDALSTFSAHVKRISEMLQNGDGKTLVLIDEIGSATDPEQGSALAQAFLEVLERKKVVGVVTTHYTSIKVFAEDTDSCINAAMHFDPEQHTPTYQFKLGLPGNSFAIEVASHLGLDSDIIVRAKELAGNQNVELTELIRKMSAEKKSLARETYQLMLKTRLFNLKTEEYAKKIKEIEENKKEIRKKSLKEAKDFLTHLQKELYNEVSSIKDGDRKKRKEKMNQMLSKVNEITHQYDSEEKELNPVIREHLKKPEIGKKVWVESFEDFGEIIEIGKKDIKVNINGFFFTTKISALFEANTKSNNSNSVTFTNFESPQKSVISEKRIRTELKILGYTFDEALPEVKTFIDDALYAGLNKIRIVHGKGTGILRSKIRKYLRSNKKVISFHTPPPEAGGDGVTIVSFN